MGARLHRCKETRDLDYKIRDKIPEGEFRTRDFAAYGPAHRLGGMFRSWCLRGWLVKVRIEREGKASVNVWQKTKSFGRRV